MRLMASAAAHRASTRNLRASVFGRSTGIDWVKTASPWLCVGHTAVSYCPVVRDGSGFARFAGDFGGGWLQL